MSQFLAKTIFVSVIFFTSCTLLIGQSHSAYTTIRNANIQIRGSLHETPLAWATDTISIKVNKQTGEFEAELLVDNLHYATANSGFNATGENKGKYLILKGTIPVYDVLDHGNSAIDRKVEITASFNDLEYRTSFTFTILTLQSGGFSVMANGTVSHRALEINNLEELDDDLFILLSFTGY